VVFKAAGRAPAAAGETPTWAGSSFLFLMKTREVNFFLWWNELLGSRKRSISIVSCYFVTILPLSCLDDYFLILCVSAFA
jgi:hypothetical protein